MPRFSSPEKQGEKQAASVMKELQGDTIQSVGTARNYEQALKNVATDLARDNLSLKDTTPEIAKSYLEARAEQVGQSQLDMERQALQTMMQNVTGKLEQGERLAVVQSEQQQAQNSRAYTAEQVQAVAEHQSGKNALSTQIAHSAGLRAHELATLAPKGERAADSRPALDTKFEGREAANYTVTGKGGLTREVSIPKELADRLEQTRLDTPVAVSDRGVNYEQHYNIGHGQAWSQSFSSASDRALGWSEGAHGVRHSYAQERMDELQSNGYSRDSALAVVSQEMGHFRPEITEVYLR